MPGGEESLRKGTYGALSTETPPEANGAQAEARVSYIQAHHCLWSESQHNEVPPPTLCTCRGPHTCQGFGAAEHGTSCSPTQLRSQGDR